MAVKYSDKVEAAIDAYIRAQDAEADKRGRLLARKWHEPYRVQQQLADPQPDVIVTELKEK
jgi:hypothetical protein